MQQQIKCVSGSIMNGGGSVIKKQVTLILKIVMRLNFCIFNIITFSIFSQLKEKY